MTYTLFDQTPDEPFEDNTKICPHCQAKMVEYKHGLTISLMRAFAKVVIHTAPGRKFVFADLTKSTLTYPQAAALQSLQYWDLIAKDFGNRTKRGGEWIITDLGMRFAQGGIALPKYVWTYRADVIRFEGEKMTIQEVTGGWKYRPDYAREAKPHE